MKINFPHEGVNARLGVSKISGVGVFAIKDIPKDTNIFPNDTMKIHWFDKIEVENLKISPEIKKLYTDFCVLIKGKYGAPVNFNSITPAWYINEPVNNNEGNVYADKDLNYFAKRDIKKGEELTTKYSLYSEHVDRY